MNKWILAPTLAAILATSGCMSNGSGNEQAATMNRVDAIATLSENIEKVGFNRVEVSPGVDEVLNICASILERQYSVMDEYRTQAENHADVQAFLYAHQGKTPEQLQLAITEFDAGATSEEDKIGPKIVAYQASIDEVTQRNTQLGIELTAQLIKLGYLTSQYGGEIAKATAANWLGGMMKADDERTADNDVALAILRAKDQLELASDANELISLEQETIEAIDGLQEELEAKG
ncbi:hypothetical protein DFP83_10134 [Idiomarina fontislapidosi]|uniref:Uncharacterized protein n=1 Tax=Idiomarina fontislapidosi TaxID=263723 RepID=A0A432YAP2_9GAMM|nr:hypothetical protein [Idiomarina fontislapidosi]PYE35160.1 hypothetical protein DFP83_10134 [Idiomarina fontislapidosi]RUO58055.1 hypothetical protein CWE25_00185 [Idiomarina fontislapidosi]|tara:strand:+ start:1818 stop:2519 length:702 start_codon:yes stop_codon:yes gene_type:complete